MPTDPTREPWRTRHWFCSPHNFDPACPRPTHPVELHDITLRDGEESADVAFSCEDKVRIAEALAAAGLRRLELFLIVPGWLETIRAILARALPLDLYVTWTPGRVERALDLGVTHVMVWYRVLEEHQRYELRRSRAELVADAADQVAAAVRAGCHANLFINEATRAPLDHLRAAVEAAADAGAAAVTIVDSYGVATPAAMAFLVRQVRGWTTLPIDVHCHNDFGLSVANVLAAYEAGATGLNVSVNALGYRAGNAALDEVVMALEVLYGVRTGIRLDALPVLSSLVAAITGVPVHYFKPISGSGAFSMERWTTAAHLEAAGVRAAAFPFEPEIIGRSPRVVVGKWSDAGAVVKKLSELGLTASTAAIERILLECQRQGVARHRPLTDDELVAIARAGGAVSSE
jgi:isopropylmalate/homocitrate/citramalate synthase